MKQIKTHKYHRQAKVPHLITSYQDLDLDIYRIELYPITTRPLGHKVKMGKLKL